MGLDTSHDAWHGGYTWFGVWRAAVARAAGCPVDVAQQRYTLDADEWLPENYYGKWHKRELSDPIMYLLVHSDCEGVIKPKHARLIADRLEELAPRIRAIGREDQGWIDKCTQRFIEGLRLAVSVNEKVVFS